jgi:archaellum biogenesis ATPase FlaH
MTLDDVTGISKIIEKPDVTLVFISKENYHESLMEMTKTLSQTYKICYVTLTEPFKSLVEELKKKNAKLSKVFFIDCISVLALQNMGKMINVDSGTIREKGVVYVITPRALDLLMMEINAVITNLKPDVIIFDSLTTLVLYNDSERVLQRIHNLTPSIKLAGSKMILTCAQEDKDQAFVKDLEMFVDNVVNLS